MFSFRTALDYAYCCHRALKQTTSKDITTNYKLFPLKVSSAIRQGYKVKRKSFDEREETASVQNTACLKKGNVELETMDTNILSGNILKKRRRSKRFKNVSLRERKKMKTRYLDLLKSLS